MRQEVSETSTPHLSCLYCVPESVPEVERGTDASLELIRVDDLGLGASFQNSRKRQEAEGWLKREGYAPFIRDVQNRQCGDATPY
jgi:hypothetical protein